MIAGTPFCIVSLNGTGRCGKRQALIGSVSEM